jgi:hypothetical protein
MRVRSDVRFLECWDHGQRMEGASPCAGLLLHPQAVTDDEEAGSR